MVARRNVIALVDYMKQTKTVYMFKILYMLCLVLQLKKGGTVMCLTIYHETLNVFMASPDLYLLINQEVGKKMTICTDFGFSFSFSSLLSFFLGIPLPS